MGRQSHHKGGGLKFVFVLGVCGVQVINRSAKYKNKFVHRRQSACVAQLPNHVVEKGIRLGLVLNTAESQKKLEQHSIYSDDGSSSDEEER